MPEEFSNLLELARKKFAPRQFSLAEEKLFRAAEIGEIASAVTGDEKQDDLANAVNWNADRVLLAECIAWLCTDREASALVTHRGIQIISMRIDGELDLGDAEIKFPFTVSNSAFTGRILLHDTRLPFLSLQGCQIKELHGDRLKVPGSVFVRDGFKADGEVRLMGATIGGSLDCLGAQFSNSNGPALTADGVEIKGSAYLRNGFKAEGEVRLLGATIGGSLECVGAQFSDSSGNALSADGVEIKGGAFLRDGFKAEGEVRLSGATIGGNLECDGAQFSNSNGRALTAEGVEIKGSAFLRDGFRGQGKVGLFGATIGSLQIRNVPGPENIVLDLQSAKVGTFWDDEHSWPHAGNLFLDGFRYERLYAESPLDAKSRKEWLRLQPRDRFLPQPYEQLAAVLREMGHERDAKLVMIAKNRDRARFTRFPRQGWWWYNFFGRAIGYGYAPWRAFAMSLAMIVLGAFLFGAGFSHDLISPTKESAYERNSRKLTNDYPAFTPLVYSLESFTPLLKLDQSANWTPNANHGAQVSLWYWRVTTGGLLRCYLWFHIISGWVLTTLWVGAVTGLVKS
jgi:hypothetical protein